MKIKNFTSSNIYIVQNNSYIREIGEERFQLKIYLILYYCNNYTLDISYVYTLHND